MTVSTTSPTGYYEVLMYNYLAEKNRDLTSKQDPLQAININGGTPLLANVSGILVMKALTVSGSLTFTSTDYVINISSPSVASKQDVIRTVLPEDGIPLLTNVSGIPTMKALTVSNGIIMTSNNYSIDLSIAPGLDGRPLSAGIVNAGGSIVSDMGRFPFTCSRPSSGKYLINLTTYYSSSNYVALVTPSQIQTDFIPTHRLHVRRIDAGGFYVLNIVVLMMKILPSHSWFSGN